MALTPVRPLLGTTVASWLRWRRSAQCSEIAEGFVVFGGVPFPKESERILELRAAARLGRLGQEDMSVRDGVSDLVARLDPKRVADRLRNGCLSLKRSLLPARRFCHYFAGRIECTVAASPMKAKAVFERR
jgi:hypothetical protein